MSGRNSNDVLSALNTWISRLDKGSPQYEHQMMEALWVQQWHNRVDQTLLKRMLRSSEPWARAAATRVLCYWRDRVPDAMALLNTQVADPHPAVRLEAVRAASFFQTPDAIRLAKSVEKDLQDRFLAYTYQQTMTTLEGLARRDSTTTANAPAEANTTATALPDLSAASMRRDLRDKGVQTIAIGTHPRADDLRRPLVRGRGRQARAADAQQRRLHAAQHRHRPARVDQRDRQRGGDHAGAERAERPRLRARPSGGDRGLTPRQRGESDTIKFTAPAKPGQYNFVCTFPGHWVRMYGVMLVVPSLDGFEAKPTVPNDPMTGKPYDAQRVVAK